MCSTLYQIFNIFHILRVVYLTWEMKVGICTVDTIPTLK